MVYLIGAGPGDPELMTLRAVRALGAADVVLVDELVDPRCLEFTRGRIIPVGKRGGCRSTPQAFIERLMIRLARAGKVVARLKGGDPFVFGRGGEELAALQAAGVEVEVVPGITAGIGIAAALGIPLTQRGTANGVAFVSGHSSQPVDWRAHRASGATLVVYMGLAQLRPIAKAMLDGGFAPSTPACVVQDGTRQSQRAVFAPLGCLADCVDSAGLVTPALVVVGQVVNRALQFHFQRQGEREDHVQRHH
jgi:uroporphyrin-III C-methyltransferase